MRFTRRTYAWHVPAVAARRDSRVQVLRAAAWTLLCAACAFALLACAKPATACADEKTETPVVTKEVGEATNDASVATSWGSAADATVGRSVAYRVTGTLPSNFSEFETYYYEFHDTADAAVTVDTASVAITLQRSSGATLDITSQFTISYADHVLLAYTEDLKAVADDITAADTIVMTYAATLDASAAVAGLDGAQVNYVYIRYTATPQASTLGRSVEASATLYTWALRLEKLAGDTSASLAGAAFTVRAQGGSYIAADGSLSDTPVELACDEDGVLLVNGLDAGTYTFSETTVPSGYAAVDDFTVTITRTLGDDVALQAQVDAVEGVELSDLDTHSGLVSVRVTDQASAIPSAIAQLLPQTGEPAQLALWICALLAIIALASALVLHVVARRRSGRNAGE